MIARMSCLLTCVFLTSACHYVSQKPSAYDLNDPPSLDYSVEKYVECDCFTCGDWPDDCWWTFFSSPQLNGLMEEALAQNPTLQAAQRRVEAASQEAILAKSKLFPWLSGDASFEYDYLSKNGLLRALNPTIPLNATLYDIKLNLQYDFDFWGKYCALFKAALGYRLAQEAEQAEVKLILVTSLAQAYVIWKQHEVRKKLLQQLFVVLNDVYELQDFLQEKSLASKLVVLESEQNVYDIKKQLWIINEQLEMSQHQINVLVGRSPDFPLAIDGSTLPSIEALTIPSDLTMDLLARRPDLMAQIWRAESLAYQVGAAKTEYYPDISLSSFLGLESVFGSLLFQSSSFTAGVKPALHLPLFTAGAIQANIDAKMALFREAIFEYNQLLLTSAKQVTDDLAVAMSLYEQKREQAELLKSIQERWELTDLLYQKGLSDQLTADIVKAELIYAQLQDLDLTTAQYLTMIRLIKDLGGGYEALYVPIRSGDCCE